MNATSHRVTIAYLERDSEAAWAEAERRNIVRNAAWEALVRGRGQESGADRLIAYERAEDAYRRTVKDAEVKYRRLQEYI